jgi:hypothetical protein
VGALATVNPIDNPSLWDTVILGGNIQSPGYCTWSGWKRMNQWDKKRGKGIRGSTQTLAQQPEASGEFVFHLWDNGTLQTGHNHFAEWDNFVTLLSYDPTKTKPQAVNIAHPALATMVPPITSVVIEEVGPLTHEGDGMYTITVKMSEFFPAPPQNAVATPTSSKDSPPGPTKPGQSPPAAQDALQVQIGQLLAKAEAT